jgi:fluoride exporter
MFFSLANTALYAGMTILMSPEKSADCLIAFGNAPLTSAKPPVLINGNASEVANKTRKLFSSQINKWYICIIDYLVTFILNKKANMAAMQWVAVGSGAAIGAWVRWGLGVALNASMLPMGTLIANLGGGLLMGMALAVFVNSPAQDSIRLFVMTGFLGGLTTFSAFSAEAFNFLHKQQYAWAAGHILSHVAGSLLMTAIGFMLVQYFKS